MNSIWIDFGDGTILGMYDDVDYGIYASMSENRMES